MVQAFVPSFTGSFSCAAGGEADRRVVTVVHPSASASASAAAPRGCGYEAVVVGVGGGTTASSSPCARVCEAGAGHSYFFSGRPRKEGEVRIYCGKLCPTSWMITGRV